MLCTKVNNSYFICIEQNIMAIQLFLEVKIDIR